MRDTGTEVLKAYTSALVLAIIYLLTYFIDSFALCKVCELSWLLFIWNWHRTRSATQRNIKI